MHANPTNKAKCFSYKVFKVHSKLTNKTTGLFGITEDREILKRNWWRVGNSGEVLSRREKYEEVKKTPKQKFLTKNKGPPQGPENHFPENIFPKNQIPEKSNSRKYFPE